MSARFGSSKTGLRLNASKPIRDSAMGYGFQGQDQLSILDGHCRYAHVGALRGVGVAPSTLGMSRIICDTACAVH